MWVLYTLLTAECLPGLSVGMTLLRIVIFPFLAVIQKHGRMYAVKISQIFCCFFQGER